MDMEGEGAGEDVVEDEAEDIPTQTTTTPRQLFKRVVKSIICLRIVARIRLIDHLLLLSPRCILFSTADVTLGLAFLVSFRGLPLRVVFIVLLSNVHVYVEFCMIWV